MVLVGDPLTVLGAFVGLVGVCIAIWLQMVAKRRVPAKYVVVFYAFGSLFLLLNTAALGAGNEVAQVVAVFSLTVALLVEVGGAVFVYLKYSEPSEAESLAEAALERVDLSK